MNVIPLLIFAVLLAALILSGWGLFNRRPSILIALAGILTLSASSLGAWYAWAETQDLSWTVGYGIIGFLALIAIGRQGLNKISQRAA